MSWNNDQISLIKCEIDIAKSLTRIGLLTKYPEYEAVVKSPSELSIILKWIAELKDVSVKNEIGYFESEQKFTIILEGNTDKFVEDAIKVFYHSQKEAKELFEFECKQRNIKPIEWELYRLPDEYMTYLISLLAGNPS